MYFDEDLILDIRLNTLEKFVDYFVIVESRFNHNGDRRELKFNKRNFEKFNNKIIYIIEENQPENIEEINEKDEREVKDKKYILNSLKRENQQRNLISKGLNKANKEDWVIISDLDEIPNLEKCNLKNSKSKFVFFNQYLFYYKLNLNYQNFVWTGSKACKKNDLISPQWLRNIKDRNYPFWRIDTWLSKNKYNNIYFVKNGGWHFSYMKSPDEIEHKLKSYLHHHEYDLNPLGKQKIQKLIDEKKAIYNLKHDQQSWNKFGSGDKLTKIDLSILPKYIFNNKKKFEKWIEK